MMQLAKIARGKCIDNPHIIGLLLHKVKERGKTQSLMLLVYATHVWK